MKIKLTSNELLSLSQPINQLCVAAMERAQMVGKDGILTADDLMHRLTAIQILKFGEKYNASTRYLANGKASIKFDAGTGLAFLACWYATDTTELPMNPLAAALLADITDRLVKQYGGPIMSKP